MDKRKQRQRRAKRGRSKIRELGCVRLCVYRSLNNTYAQLIDADAKILAVASTLEKDLRGEKHSGNKKAAATVGKLIAERAIKLGIKKVAFDRSGYKYHGRVMALANAARETGLEF